MYKRFKPVSNLSMPKKNGDIPGTGTMSFHLSNKNEADKALYSELARVCAAHNLNRSVMLKQCVQYALDNMEG